MTGDSRETIIGLGLQSGLLNLEELDDPYVCMTGKELVEVCTLDTGLNPVEAKEKLEMRKSSVVNRL